MNTSEVLTDMQRAVAKEGLHTALWKDGDTWHFLAASNAQWVEDKCHELSKPECIIQWLSPVMVTNHNAKDVMQRSESSLRALLDETRYPAPDDAQDIAEWDEE